jgi:heat shock protein HtpX
MFTEYSGPGAVVIVLALAIGPALLRWWWGRPLARLADDPLIAERLLEHHSRVGMLAGACLLVMCVGWLWSAPWSVPLLLLAQVVASHPLARSLYGETWSLAASVSFYTRLPLAIFGFSALLAGTPWIVRSAGDWDWIAAAVLAVALVLWERYHEDLVRALLRSEPIADPVLVERFAELVARSGIPAPRFEWVQLHGGVLANAVALPSLRRSSVVFTDTLISRLQTDEVVAICAHEIAHLEYFDRTRMWRMQIVNWLLIGLVCAVTPVSGLFFSPLEQSTLPATICTFVAVVALALRGRHRQRHETNSDLRAVELTGNPEALASALTALHAIARMPRRWDRQREQHATHPSLARRIRDIRAAAGTPSPGTVENTATFRASRGDAVVTFDPAHVRWQDAPGTTHVLEYGTLAELRLRVSPVGEATLVAVERQGRRWTMPTRAEDAAALQSMLDAVDGRLANAGAAVAISAPLVRLVAIFIGTIVAMLGQFALALVAIIAALAPAMALLNAAGAAAFLAAAVLMAHGGGDDATNFAFAAILAFLGAIFMLMAYFRRTDAAQPPRLAVAVLAAGAIGATLGITLGGLDAVRLHQGARDLAAAPVLLGALAAACWHWRTRRPSRLRHVPLAAALAALTIVALGSAPVLELIGRDPFLARAAPLRWTFVEGEPERSFDIPFEIESLRLSASGRLAAFVRAEYDDASGRSAPPLFHLRRGDGSLAALQGSDLAFIDDRRVLLLALDEAGAEVSVASFDGAPPLDWRERVPGIRAASLTYSAAPNQWALIGRDVDGNVVRATGTVGQAGVRRTAWKNVTDLGGWINAIGTRGEAAIAIQKNYDYGILPRALAMRLPLGLAPTFPESRIWRLGSGARGNAGRSLLDVSCGLEPRDGESVVCTVFDGTRTRIVTIEPATAAITALGTMDGAFYADPASAAGWLTGWWCGAPAIVHLETRLVLRMPSHAIEHVRVVAATAGVIGAAGPIDGGTRVRLYPLATAISAASRAE